ncbi:MAG: hypothetical protein WD598_12830 [Acidimicrobiia bacterium]
MKIRACGVRELCGIAALVLGVLVALSVTAVAATHRGEAVDPVSSSTTTTLIELGPATSVTEEPESDVPTTKPVEVKGERAVVEGRGGASWAWWLLLLLLLAPLVGFVFGITRRRLDSARR